MKRMAAGAVARPSGPPPPPHPGHLAGRRLGVATKGGMAEAARVGSCRGGVPSGDIDGVAEEADGLTGAPEAAGIGDVIDMERFFRPRAIAIIGASVKPDTISGRPIQFLKKQRYQGAVYPVNPKYEEVAGYRCYPDIESVPGPVDVAIIAVA